MSQLSSGTAVPTPTAEPTITNAFPGDFFPPGLESFRASAARSLGISDEYLSVPMLAAASAAIGCAATVTVKPGWEEPASLFLAVVGFKSSGKTPAYRLALRPLEEQQRDREKAAAHREARRAASINSREPRFGGVGIAPRRGRDVRRGRPPKPLEHLVVQDTTQAALWEILHDSPRGIVVAVDELASVFLQTTPAQRQIWCEVYQASRRTVHRKTRSAGPLILPRTFVTLAGGIQPDLFPCIRGKYDGGLAERFLFCGVPEASLPPWSDEVLDPDADTAWHLAIAALLQIERAEYKGSPERRGFVPFSRAAYERLRQLRDTLTRYLQARNVHVRHHGIVRKLEANAARLALIRRCLRWATGEFGFYGPIGAVDEADCDAACRAAEFFLTRYLLWMPQVMEPGIKPGISPMPTGLAERLLAYIASKGRMEVEVRWLRQQTLEGNPSTAEIRAALNEAVARGQGRWGDDETKVFIRT